MADGRPPGAEGSHAGPVEPGRAAGEQAERDPFERHVQALKRLAEHPDPYLVQASPDFDPADLELQPPDEPLPQATFGDIGLAAKVGGASSFPATLLILPYDLRGLRGVDALSVRVFRLDEDAGRLRPMWQSGINTAFGFVWAEIRRAGLYTALGLPRDLLLREALRAVARQRRFADDDSPETLRAIIRSAFAPLLELPVEALQQLRRELAQLELQTSARTFSPHETQAAHGAHALPWPLPDDLTVIQFRERLRRLEPPAAGFPEEELFFAPDTLDDPEPPWPLPLPRPAPWPLPLPMWPWPPPWPLPRPIPWPPAWLCWFLSRDWRMYHHDERHSGHASGCSAITSTSVGGMTLRLSVPVDGPVITIPTIVQGKIYVGSSDAAGVGGTLYKIDLASGTVEHTFSVPQRFPAYSQGIGGSPAVVGGKVYFTAIPGQVYCLDAATFTLLWSVDLRNPDPAHNQPVQNQSWTDSRSSPLVVGGKVYVGCGEGEGGAFGFVYCLDATTGNVIWLFCTNKFPGLADNQPNVIPTSAVGISPLPAPFTAHADPAEVGVSIWSSCAYDAALDRIYVGTGNALSGDFNPLPDAPYGSGVLALDAATGAFQGFFEPAAADCYRQDDTDVDICGSPTVFARGGARVVGIGSKGGGYFLLDAATMAPVATRQLLPYQFNNPANPLPNVDPHTGPGENMYGVFGTAAIHYGLGRLFVGVGGYGGAIDTPTTPFVRALDWTTLNDAWPTTVGGDGVTRYTAPGPLYANPGEVGLSSPAVVNDVVFVSTDRPGLYALSAATGLCLWSAGGLSPGYILGPAVYGNMVVVGSGSSIKVYSL